MASQDDSDTENDPGKLDSEDNTETNEDIEKDSEADAASEVSEPGENDTAEADDNSEESNDAEPKGPNLFKRLLTKYKAKKKITIPLTVVALLLLIFGLPLTRYTVLGLVIKKDFSVVVLDSKTNIPVSGAEINLRGKLAKTDGEGRATLSRVTIGPGTIKTSKNYYNDQQTRVTVPLGSQKNNLEIKLEANGRQVPVYISNKINGTSLAGAVIKAVNTEAETDSDGETTMVLPPDQATVKGEISLPGYNTLSVDITIQDNAVKNNSFQLVPSGKIYFLSKRTGKIDVMKSDLDGSNAQSVLKATGNEVEDDTILVATRDWKYLALKSRREGKTGRFYLINTSNDQLTEVDGGSEQDVTFVGWSGHNFVYQIQRNDVKEWKSNRNALKTYNADNTVITIVDETKAEGSSAEDYASEAFGNIHILSDRIIYTKHWYTNSYYGDVNLANKRNVIVSVSSSGSDKQTLKDLPVSNDYNDISSTQSEPNEIYFSIYNYDTNKNTYYTYENGAVTEDKQMTDEKYNKPYPTYVLSPSGERTFWFEERDGKNNLFVGDRGGKNPKQVEIDGEDKPYGWFSEDYVLVSKHNSELYIRPASELGSKGQIVKITNYHRPAYFLTYGGGY